eukprot:CAMPEP_0183733574 /NCGR_PEP_ID=MMETSP0737-20130205/41572_1 /TAXON_ID=385413 /ORGANISM="Thalassiosira miniscula, Strain CCMP1093" /LENGTH=86 /DNA_ID=CAMNT_0025966859 /DNA_START=179 /DNA_END=435 /DNA_ORIENTATION=-
MAQNYDPSDNSGQNAYHKRETSKLISIESTADGDIQTVEERKITHVNNAFTHHLRDSFDETFDNGGNGGDAATSTRLSHHKQNLSV